MRLQSFSKYFWRSDAGMSESNFWGVQSGPEPHIIQGPGDVDFPARLRLQFSGAVSVADIDGKTVVEILSGRRGEPGPSGDTGPMPTIAAEAKPLVYTSDPTVEVIPTPTGVLLTFGIPQGLPGERGMTGETGSQGEKGDNGKAATIEIGTVTTGDPGTAADVSNTGTSGAAIFNFTIPQGEKGERGDPGPVSIMIGNVTTGEPGTPASVTNTGTEQDIVLSFSIPRGEKGIQGQTGAPGPQGAPGASGIDGAPIWQLRGE